MAAKKVVKKIKVKKKKWFDIALPVMLRGDVFTEGYAESAEKLIGRTINASLGDILKSAGKRHINVKLVVDDVKINTAHTSIKSLAVGLPYLQRKSRKNSVISAKVVDKTSDGKIVDLRLAVISNGHCLTTAKKDIRQKLTSFIKKTITSGKKDALINDVISGKVQNSIKKDMHKVHPVKSVELEKMIIKQ